MIPSRKTVRGGRIKQKIKMKKINLKLNPPKKVKGQLPKVNCSLGFTLLLSLIVVSAVLSVGLGVFDIVYRELILSGIGRESQKAFYAADTGIECALYWDVKRGEISTSSPSTIECAGQSASVGGLTSAFQITLPDGSCFKVIVDKSDPARTVLESRGYNTACDSTGLRKVERALRVSY